MRIKVLTSSGQTMSVLVSEPSQETVATFLASGEAPEGWILVTDTESGWPARLNLAQCVRVEKAAV